jgi:protocatechuate 3,4-dioxygenase beta subunit
MRQLALLLLWAISASAQTVKPDELSSVEGRVLSAATGQLVGKAAVSLVRINSTLGPADWMLNYSVVSDSAGKFVIANIDPGKYRLRASHNGFLDLEYGAHGPQTTGAVLDLERSQQMKDIDLRLTPYGVLTGRILDADREAVVNAQVQFVRSQYVNGKKALAATTTASTNDLGEYRVFGLKPGKYYIYAQDFFGPPTLSGDKEQYVPVYYPGVSDLAGAVPIDVPAGAQASAGDMMLRKALTVTAKGKVVVELTETTGLPTVTFNRQIGHSTVAVGSFRTAHAKVGASGEFEVRGLTPGSYMVMAAIASGGIGRTSPTTTVDVGATNVEGLVLKIGNYASAPGRIRVEGGAMLDMKSLRVKDRRGGLATADSGYYDPGTRVSEDGAFELENLIPDRYGIVVSGLPDGFYTKSIRAGETEITYSGFELGDGPPPRIDVLVSPKAATVSGVAQNPDAHNTAAGATVVLVPKEEERVQISELYRQTVTDQNGRFTFKSVAPGEYKVYAWEDVESTAWMDPEFMKPLDGKGEPVTLGESAQVNVQVTVIPAESQKERPK